MIATKATQTKVFNGFHPLSKVWIYTSNRFLTDEEVIEIEKQLVHFTKQWTAHDIALKGAGTVYNNQFIVLAVDESQANTSGCSIDKSVHFIKTIESQFNLQLFDRLTIYYQSNDELKSFHFNNLKEKIALNEISKSTQIFDTTITQLGVFENEFVKEAGKSWLTRFMK